MHNLVLIDKRVIDYAAIVDAVDVGNDVHYIVFDVFDLGSGGTGVGDTDVGGPFAAMQAKISELNIPAFHSVGLVQHNDNAPFYQMFGFTCPQATIMGVETSDASLQTWQSVTDFINWLKTHFGIVNFDLMACALYSNVNWKYIIDTLSVQTGVELRASTDNTGSEGLGGDWFLESHTGVNLKGVYFTEAIEEYRGILYRDTTFVRKYSTKGFSTGTVSNSGGGNPSTSDIESMTSGVVAIYSTSAAFAALKTDGRVITWGSSSYGGDSSSVASDILSGVVAVYSTLGAFAALKSNGRVITWGSSSYGGDSSSVASDISSGVVAVYSNYGAFVALKSNGMVVRWGANGGGSQTSVDISSGVVAVYSTMYAFAVLKSNGSVITLGAWNYGGNSSSVASDISSGVVAVYSTDYAFAALKSNGRVIAWGDSNNGGYSASVTSDISSGVVAVYSTLYAFAALKSNGSVVTWGGGGVSVTSGTSLATSLASGVVTIYSNGYAFAALKRDGRVIAWGQDGNGANAPSGATSEVVAVYAGKYAFAALKRDGSIITWGQSGYGGNSTSMAQYLTSGVVNAYGTLNGMAALKNNGSVVLWGTTSRILDSSGVIAVYSTEYNFATIKTTATTFDLSMSYYTDMDRYDILRKKENRRRVNLTTLNNNVFTISQARDIQSFNMNIPSGKTFRIIVPGYEASSYSFSVTATIPSSSENFIIACDEGEWVSIGGSTFVNHGSYVYRCDATSYVPVSSITVNGQLYYIYGGDGVYSSGIALLYLIPPTLTNFIINSKIYGDASFNITDPSSNSTGAFTFTSGNTSVATISGRTVTISGIGTSTITATQAAAGDYSQSTTTTSFVVAAPTLSNFSVPSKMYGDASFNLVDPSSNSAAAFTFTSSNTAVAAISGRTVTITGVGTSVITANQGVDISASLVVNFGNLSSINRNIIDGGFALLPISKLTTSASYTSTFVSNTAIYGILGSTNGERFGGSASISADGSIVAIGAPLNTTSKQDGNGGGSVRVYKYNNGSNTWSQLGQDIVSEYSGDENGYSVSLSANGTIVAIGARTNDGSGNVISQIGSTRVFKYNALKTTAQLTNQNLSTYGPVGWDQLGRDIDGEAADECSGYSVCLSADGTIVAIGVPSNNGLNASGNVLLQSGHTRVYKYNPSKTTEQLTNQNLSTYGPVGWDRLGGDIDGEAAYDVFGSSVKLSADGTILAVTAVLRDGSGNLLPTSGSPRVYKYNASKTTAQLTNQNLSTYGPVGWDRLGGDIVGLNTYNSNVNNICLSADGKVVAIGPFYNENGSSNPGIIRIYSWNGSSWSAMSAIGAGSGELFKNGCLSSDGTTMAILITGTNNVGTVTLRKYNGWSWETIATMSLGSVYGDINLNLSSDGSALIIGIPLTNYMGSTGVGATYIYKINSSGNYTYTLNNQSIADICGNIMLPKSSGSTTMTISQAAYGENNSVSMTIPVTLSLTETTITRTTDTSGTISKTYASGLTFSVAATSSRGTAVSYASSDTSVATVDSSSGLVTVLKAGPTTISASQTETTQYAAGSASWALTVALGTNPWSNTFAITSPKTYGDTVTYTAPVATYSPAGAITYSTTTDVSNVATINESTGAITLVGNGTVTFRATQAETDKYASSTIDSSAVTVNRAITTITRASDAYVGGNISKTYIPDLSFSLTATTSRSDGSAVLYSSSDTSVATVDASGRVTVLQGTAAGSPVTLTAYQAENAQYAYGSNTWSLTVSLASNAITRGANFTDATITRTYDPTSTTFNVSVSSNNSISDIVFTSSDTNVASITRVNATTSQITINTAGSITITASQSASNKYTAALDISCALVINRRIATLFRSAPYSSSSVSKYYDPASFYLAASSVSDGAVTYESDNSGVAQISNTTGEVTLYSLGSATITASQANSSRYTTPFNVVWTLDISRGNTTITGISSDISKNVTNAPFYLSASSASSGAITYSLSDPSSNVATVNASSGLVTLLAAGTCTVVVSQAGTTLYNAPTPFSSTITVSGAGNTLQNVVVNPVTQNFVNVDLSGASLAGATLSGVSFVNANLTNTDFSGANISGANFTNANISGTNISELELSTVQKLQLLKNINNREIPEIQIPEYILGEVLVTVVSQTSTLLEVPNINPKWFKIIIPTTSTSPSATLTNTIIDAATNVDGFYFPINEGEYFKINGVKYYTVGSVTKNYETNATVETITNNGKQYRLVVGSLTGVALQANTLSASTFIGPIARLLTDTAPIYITTAPTSNSDAAIVYSSNNPSVATINATTGQITMVSTGSVTFTASQVETLTYASGSIISNTLTIYSTQVKISFNVSALDSTLQMDISGTTLETIYQLPASDATSVFYVKLADMKDVFKFQTDSFDVNDASLSDVRYYVYKNKWPSTIKLNPAHSMINVEGSSGMMGSSGMFDQNKALLKHDYIRYLAYKLFRTIHGVDLFKNESDLLENLTYWGETIRNDIESKLDAISTTSSDETMTIDDSGNRFLTNDLTANTNISRELMMQIAGNSRNRLFDISGTTGIQSLPLMENDSFNILITVFAAENQNNLTGADSISSRTYNMKVVLKNDITGLNVPVIDSEMFPNAYPYSGNVAVITADSSSNYVDYSPPAALPVSRYGFNGWYYKNTSAWVTVDPTVRNKIKWSVSPNTGSTKVSDLQYLRVNVKVYNKTSLPYITVYTASSKRAYVISNSASITNNGKYTFYANFNAYTRLPAVIDHTNQELTVSSSGALTQGSFDNNEIITRIALETDSSASYDAVEFTMSCIVVGETSSEKEHWFQGAILG